MTLCIKCSIVCCHDVPICSTRTQIWPSLNFIHRCSGSDSQIENFLSSSGIWIRSKDPPILVSWIILKCMKIVMIKIKMVIHFHIIAFTCCIWWNCFRLGILCSGHETYCMKEVVREGQFNHFRGIDIGTVHTKAQSHIGIRCGVVIAIRICCSNARNKKT